MSGLSFACNRGDHRGCSYTECECICHLSRECDICGRKFEAAEAADRLCELCLVCESTRIQGGAVARLREAKMTNFTTRAQVEKLREVAKKNVATARKYGLEIYMEDIESVPLTCEALLEAVRLLKGEHPIPWPVHGDDCLVCEFIRDFEATPGVSKASPSDSPPAKG
jgi:hypothetical protein